MKSIACNLIYNNGDEGIYVGFNGRCSLDTINYNINKGTGRWCSQKMCSCKNYYDRGFKGRVKEYPCTESNVFNSWSFSAGAEFETGELFRMKEVSENKIAVLTTVFPGKPESERKIVGFFKIDNVMDDLNVVSGNEQTGVRLLLSDSQNLNFWRYHKNHKNPKKPRWSQGRFRYLDDKQIASILHDIKVLIQDEQIKSMIQLILNEHLKEYADNRPAVIGAIEGDNLADINKQRKYGQGGESEAHKKLKEHIAKNPQLLGLKKSEVISKIEHPYVSGDQVDILFEPRKGKENTVVEIELDNVVPGIHQAIKYRALRCSQLGIPLNSKDVSAFVVAWKLSSTEKSLCSTYGIKYLEIKL